MWLPDIKREILTELRELGPLNHFELADVIGEAPFRVRAELHDLRRDQLVCESIGELGHRWRLSARGERAAWNLQQMELQ